MIQRYNNIGLSHFIWVPEHRSRLLSWPCLSVFCGYERFVFHPKMQISPLNNSFSIPYHRRDNKVLMTPDEADRGGVVRGKTTIELTIPAPLRCSPQRFSAPGGNPSRDHTLFCLPWHQRRWLPQILGWFRRAALSAFPSRSVSAGFGVALFFGVMGWLVWGSWGTSARSHTHPMASLLGSICLGFATIAKNGAAAALE